MAERRNYRYRPKQPRGLPHPFRDLRELLDFKKQQREREEQEGGPQTQANAPPADPPSILRDRLRGDFPSTSQYRKNDSQQGYGARGRGSFRRRGGGPRYMQDGSNRHEKELFTYNIKVELSTETGQRKYTLDNENPLNQNNESNPSGAYGTNQENTYHSQNRRGYPRNRGNYRGPRRGQGNYREVYYYRGQNRKYSPKNQQTDTSNIALKTDNVKKGVPPINTTTPELYEEENWDNDDVPSTNVNESKCNTSKEGNSESSDLVNQSKEEYADSQEEYGSQEGQEYLEGQEEYTSEDGQYIDEQHYVDTEGDKDDYYNEEYGTDGNYYEESDDINKSEDERNDKQLSEDSKSLETEPKAQDEGMNKQTEKDIKEEMKEQNIEDQATDGHTKNMAATGLQSENITIDQENVTPADKTGNTSNLNNGSDKKSSEIKKVGSDDSVTNIDEINKDKNR